jgi:hypothetical protein
VKDDFKMIGGFTLLMVLSSSFPVLDRIPQVVSLVPSCQHDGLVEPVNQPLLAIGLEPLRQARGPVGGGVVAAWTRRTGCAAGALLRALPWLVGMGSGSKVPTRLAIDYVLDGMSSETAVSLYPHADAILSVILSGGGLSPHPYRYSV